MPLRRGMVYDLPPSPTWNPLASNGLTSHLLSRANRYSKTCCDGTTTRMPVVQVLSSVGGSEYRATLALPPILPGPACVLAAGAVVAAGFAAGAVVAAGFAAGVAPLCGSAGLAGAAVGAGACAVGAQAAKRFRALSDPKAATSLNAVRRDTWPRNATRSVSAMLLPPRERILATFPVRCQKAACV